MAKPRNELAFVQGSPQPSFTRYIRRRVLSVLAKAVLNNEVIEVIASGQFEQVLACSLPERQVDLVGLKKQLYDVFLRLQFNVAGQNCTEERRLPL